MASAIESTCSAHAGTCDLANPDSPSSTVALVRSVGTAIEYLVLGDSPVALRTSDGIMPVIDDRVDHLQPGGRPYTRDLVRSKRNAPGGFWVASTNPQAAYEAISGIMNDVTHVALLTDGLTRLVEYYGHSWGGIFELLGSHGPSGLIRRVREAERNCPPPTYGYGKQHDDATAVYIQVT
jgi:Protein phosphatase 2C